MTACVNKKHSRRVAAAISASLVGALTLGAAPAVVMAQDAPIDTLIADEDYTTGEATFTATNGVSDNPVEIPENQRVAFPYGTGEFLLPTTITPKDSNTRTLKLTGSNQNAAVQYYKGETASGRPSDVIAGLGVNQQSMVNPYDYNWTEGFYTVRIFIQDGSSYNGKYYDFTFRIVGTDLDKAVVTNTETGGTSFTWDGEAQPVSVTVDGIELASTSYDIYYFMEGGSLGASDAKHEVTGAGKWIAAIYTHGATNWGDVLKQVPFTVDQLDLTTADVNIGDLKLGTSGFTSCTANGADVLSHVDIHIDGAIPSANGTYSATVSAKVNDSDVKGKVSNVKFAIVTNVIAPSAFTYNGSAFNDMKVDLSDAATLYDKSKIAVAGVDMKDVDIWYTTADGKEATEADLKTPGIWRVNVRVNAEATGWAQGSDTESFLVRVIAGTVSNQDISFRYKGDVVSSITKEYDGEDALDYIDTIVRDGDKTLEAGKDYELVVEKGGKVVDSIIDAGNYTLTIKSDAYDLQGQTSINVKVTAVTLNQVYVDSPLMKEFTAANGTVTTLIPYTGEAIDPEFSFYYMKDGKRVDLPEGVIEIDEISIKDAAGTYKEVDGLKDEGWYRIDLKLAKGVVNYTFTAAPAANEVLVNATGVFVDVPNDAWYAESVYEAKAQGYINGYAGNMFFGPENLITRGDVAVVLFNMGGGSRTVSEDLKNEWKTYSTKFSDVDGNAYYAEAIGWAAKLGIVNGYADGTFHPDQAVSAQEFACMLANYAKATGVDVDAAEADLSEYPGGDQVADFAKESMEWAVSEGIMGNNGANLAPTSSIMRCRVAAMAVNFQPKKLDDSQFLQ